jgi:hypothetical protein
LHLFKKTAFTAENAETAEKNYGIIKAKNIRNLFATEVTEATERFTFKNQKKKANAWGICFDGAGSDSFPLSASISLCSR